MMDDQIEPGLKKIYLAIIAIIVFVLFIVGVALIADVLGIANLEIPDTLATPQLKLQAAITCIVTACAIFFVGGILSFESLLVSMINMLNQRLYSISAKLDKIVEKLGEIEEIKNKAGYR